MKRVAKRGKVPIRDRNLLRFVKGSAVLLYVACMGTSALCFRLAARELVPGQRVVYRRDGRRFMRAAHRMRDLANSLGVRRAECFKAALRYRHAPKTR